MERHQGEAGSAGSAGSAGLGRESMQPGTNDADLVF